MTEATSADTRQVRPLSALWGVPAAALLAASFIPIVYLTRSILALPAPHFWNPGHYGIGPAEVPARYWWSWAVALLILATIGLIALLAKRTRRIAFVYLPLVALLALVQMGILLGYEFDIWSDQWDTGDSGRYESASSDRESGSPGHTSMFLASVAIPDSVQIQPLIAQAGESF